MQSDNLSQERRARLITLRIGSPLISENECGWYLPKHSQWFVIVSLLDQIDIIILTNEVFNFAHWSKSSKIYKCQCGLSQLCRISVKHSLGFGCQTWSKTYENGHISMQKGPDQGDPRILLIKQVQLVEPSEHPSIGWSCKKINKFMLMHKRNEKTWNLVQSDLNIG